MEAMKRICHPYYLWEDYNHNFYDNHLRSEEVLRQKAIEFFNKEQLVEFFMNKVIDEWKHSCEHNLTNNELNRVMYLNQASCCLHANIPSYIIVEAWDLLPKEIQDRSNNLAEVVLQKWIDRNSK